MNGYQQNTHSDLCALVPKKNAAKVCHSRDNKNLLIKVKSKDECINDLKLDTLVYNRGSW